MSPREVTEQWEIQNLAPQATKSSHSKSREEPEEKCPIRTEFQRDRDRIIHSKAFRRLMHKTQVFIAPRGDHYRTRLTHTLEVSQIARTLSRALRLNEDLTEAIALGHDLGHPPFGHEGEEALDFAYQQFDPDSRFYHFEQSLRVIKDLEKDGNGLNLTWETLDGISHHSKGQRDLFTNTDNFDPGERYEPSTLEGQIVRFADRIAYVNHDLDDAIRGGIISPEDIPGPCREVLGEKHAQRITTMVTDIITHGLIKGRVTMSKEVIDAMNQLKDFLFARVYLNKERVKAETGKVKHMLSALFKHYMDNPSMVPNSAHLEPDENQFKQARLVCDYIAGMTDRYAMQQFTSIFTPQGWEVA